MHIFLTGAVGCGKSTVIDRALARTTLAVGGFRTGFGPDRASGERSLYLWGAWEAPVRDAHHTVAHFQAGVPCPLPGRFDALGTACLARPAELIIMDECGRLERDAPCFQAAVLEKLDGDTPILGAVRQGLPGWTKAIAAHPKVKIVEVTLENRNLLPDQIHGFLSL